VAVMKIKLGSGLKLYQTHHFNDYVVVGTVQIGNKTGALVRDKRDKFAMMHSNQIAWLDQDQVKQQMKGIH